MRRATPTRAPRRGRGRVNAGGGGPGADEVKPSAVVQGVAVNDGRRSAKVRFTGSDDVTAPSELTFTCKLDDKPAKPCTSPWLYKRLSHGRHKVQVRAIDAAGNISAAAAQAFRVKRV